MSRRLDTDEWYNRGYKRKNEYAYLWQNKESLEKYISRLRELMADGGDESAIQHIKEHPEYKINENIIQSPL